jgi:hypothetical protein
MTLAYHPAASYHVMQGKGITAGTKQMLARWAGTTLRLQRSLHQVLESASVEEINFILCATNFAALVEVAPKDTIAMLAGRRLKDLTTVSKCVLVGVWVCVGGLG